jgi:hypothetical protein
MCNNSAGRKHAQNNWTRLNGKDTEITIVLKDFATPLISVIGHKVHSS